MPLEQVLQLSQLFQQAVTMNEYARKNADSQGPKSTYLVAPELLSLSSVLWRGVADLCSDLGLPALENYGEQCANEAIEHARMYADSRANARSSYGL